MIRNTQLNIIRMCAVPSLADTALKSAGIRMNKGATVYHQGLLLSVRSGGWDERDVLFWQLLLLPHPQAASLLASPHPFSLLADF